MKPFDTETIEALEQPLDASLIKHRPGSRGMMLKYLSGHDVIAAANRVFGFGAWGYTVVARSHEVITDGKKGQVDMYTCDVELRVTATHHTFPGDGVGIVNAPYTAESHEQARKSATTDALKRALRHYGDQFGLCLYSEDEYVDAGNGTLVQVKDVTPQQQQQRRVVDAHANSSKPSALPPGTRERVKTLFDRAVEKGVCANDRDEFAVWCSSVLASERILTPGDLLALSGDDLQKIGAAL